MAKMNHLGLGLEQHLAAGLAHPPAQVDVLDVQEVALVEALDDVEILAAHAEAGPRDGRHRNHAFGRGLGLPVHLVAAPGGDLPRQVAEAHQRADRRDVATPRAALLGAVGVEHPPPDQGRDRAPVDGANQLGDAAGLQEGVRIEEDDGVAGRAAGAEIGAAGEADIAMAGQQPHTRVAFGKALQARRFHAGRTVVHDHELVDQRVGEHAFDALLQRLAGHVDDHDDGHFAVRLQEVLSRRGFVSNDRCGDAVHPASLTPTAACSGEAPRSTAWRVTSGGLASKASLLTASSSESTD